jgi:hypothetical protein
MVSMAALIVWKLPIEDLRILSSMGFMIESHHISHPWHLLSASGTGYIARYLQKMHPQMDLEWHSHFASG